MFTNKLGLHIFQRGFNAVVMLGLVFSLVVSDPTAYASQINNSSTLSSGAWVDAQDYSTVTQQSAAKPSTLSIAAASNAPLDVPETVVGSGIVNDFYRASTVLEWHSKGYCPPIIKNPQQPQAPADPGDVLETVNRVSLTGVSPDRRLYSRDVRVTNSCNPYFLSNVVFDGNYMYWVDQSGLEKLSRNANVGDVPTVLTNAVADGQPYQIALNGQFVYLSRGAYVSSGPIKFFNPSRMEKVDTSSGVLTGLDCTLVLGILGCPYGVDLKVDPSGRYLYYIDTNKALQRMDLSSPTTIKQLATNVNSYFPDGSRFFCVKFICISSDVVFIGRGLTTPGNTQEILSFNNANNTSTQIYSSSYTNGASINDITADANEIFFFEVRENTCTGICFPSYTGWLYRSGRGNASALANIYQTPYELSTSIVSSYQLDTDGTKLYWTEVGNILRLSNQATALPKSPMEVTGIEVTQGVQTAGNTVPLIQGKRTFVRVYVKSDDSTRDVPGITARLRATWTGGSLGGVGDWIDPSSVFSITVKRNPSRTNLNDGFLFELPFDWLNGDNLVVTAELNPNHDPEQTDNYVNNVLSSKSFHLNPAPRLELRLFNWYYNLAGTEWGPGYAEAFGNEDWIRRAYPMDESQGSIQTPGNGLRVSVTSIYDNNLANLVRYPSWPCEDKGTISNPNPAIPDCQNLRASAYVASQEGGLRSNYEQWYGDSDSTTYYGMISQSSELRGNPATTVTYFPRGQDGGKNAAGPAGNSFLGWYAGHEVGHSVGMGHPATAAAANECGIQGSDPLPTYAHGHIGGTDNATTVMGFLDTPSYNYPRYDNSNLALGNNTFDVMAYCLPQWLSDQNYIRIYTNLKGVAPTAPVPASPATSGDWLSVYGSIDTSANTANVDFLEHVVGNVVIPPITAGGYSIRLLDGGGITLADHPFTPDGDNESVLENFGQVVPFVAGTRDLKIIRLGDGKVLADVPISAHSPVISDVHLVSAPNPVSGTITLAWTASHPDGLSLKFDIFYSRDNGATFQPFMMNMTAQSQAVDTSKLGGGTGIFRVVASDGANTASADSAAFTMSNKPPVVAITLPVTDIHALYGQVINFSGQALDAQDGTIPDSGLTWSSAAGTLGTGHLLTESLLPPGVNVITLTAKNSAGLSAKANVTVTIDDAPEPDGPSMQVTPGVVSWAINAGVTTKQTQTLTVTNYGTGSLAWTVSSDSPWLTVSATSGGDGTSITVTGDPTGMADGATRIGNLIFNSSSSGTPQVLKVAVSLTKGDIYLGPTTLTRSSTFLAFIQH